jgi:RNA polymerase sigma factor for flagellar operon FliA
VIRPNDALRLKLPGHDGAPLPRPPRPSAPGDARSDDPRDLLWRKFIRTRRRAHRNDLALSYVPLVRLVAEEIAARVPKSIDPEDLVSVGVFGLLQAIESFDPSRNVKFETFCRMRIRGAMIDELRTHDRLSRDARQRARDVFGARFRLRQELGREPNHHELAERARLTTTELERILARVATRQTLSLDVAIAEVVDDDETLLLGDDLVDRELPEPCELALRTDLLKSIAGSLTKAERHLVMLRYRDGLTMRKIGRRLGLSESRVCQIHSKVMLRLKSHFKRIGEMPVLSAV